MREDIKANNPSLIESYARARRRAVLLAVAACALAVGVVLGAALSGHRAARAGDGEVSREMASAFVEIARQVEPSVVNLSTVSRPAERTARGTRELPEDHPSLDLFPFGRERGTRRGTGSGVIVDPQGYVLTNNHVIEGADRIRVKLYDGTELTAKLVGNDVESDLAVIKIESRTPLAAARLGDSDKVRVGDWVLAIGSPFGLDQTVTAGIISAKDREATELSSSSRFQHFLQTDAAINRGNSGGPLINLAGEVIGINTAIATSTGDYNGIGFAFPSSEAVAVYNQLVKQGNVVRGFLGVIPERVTPQIAKIYGLPAARGAIISNVNETIETRDKSEPTPAFKAGLRRNDIVTEFRGEKVKDELDFTRRIAATPVGTAVQLKFYRDGKEMTATVIIGRRPDGREETPSEPELLSGKAEKTENQTIGLNIALLTPQQAREFRLGEVRGVIVVQVEPGSVAEDAGVRRNDVIEVVNREPVTTTEQFQRVIDRVKAGEPIVLQVVSRSRQFGVSRRFISFNKP
jgi:serine protease Do